MFIVLNFQTLNATEEIQHSWDYPEIRIFDVGKSWSDIEEDDISSINFPWTKPNPSKPMLNHETDKRKK